MPKGTILKILGKALWSKANTNTIFLILIVLLLFGIVFRDSLTSIKVGNTSVHFNGQEWKYLYEIETGFRQLTRDAEREIDRTDIDILNMYTRAYTSYYGAKGNTSTYRHIVHEVLKDNIKEFTMASVYRNHFPDLKDTAAVAKYTKRISMAALSLSVSEIEDDWSQVFPDLERFGYNEYLKKYVNSRAIEAKCESLIRIETLKLSIIHTIQLAHPEKSEVTIKRDWTERW